MEPLSAALSVALVLYFAAYLAKRKRPNEEPCEDKSFAYCATCHRSLLNLCQAKPPLDTDL